MKFRFLDPTSGRLRQKSFKSDVQGAIVVCIFRALTKLDTMCFRVQKEYNIYIVARFHSLFNFTTNSGFPFFFFLRILCSFCFILRVLGWSDIGCLKIMSSIFISYVTIPYKDTRGQHMATKLVIWDSGGKKLQQSPLVLGSRISLFSTIPDPT